MPATFIPGSDQRLKFSSDGTFQITVFSDLHYGEAEDGEGPINDAKTGDVVRKVLENEHTQLVVLNGDLITGDNIHKENSTDYLDQVVAPIVKADLPWASAYGNHDHQPNLLSEDILRREKTYNNSLTQNMVAGNSSDVGVTNYYLSVYPASGSEVPELILWFFDSRGGNLNGRPSGQYIKRPDWVEKKVATWFVDTNARLKEQYNKTIPSLAFFHIPVNATLAFQQTEGVDPKTEPGINMETVISQGRQYPASYKDWDVPFMKVLLDTEGLRATFSGHDHLNDWCFKWNGTISGTTLPGNGINMCYGRHTGYGGYGDVDRGGRQIVLKRGSDDITTWIRLENGSVTANVTLNSTNGQDECRPPIHGEGDPVAVRSQGGGFVQEPPSTILSLLLLVSLSLRLWRF